MTKDAVTPSVRVVLAHQALDFLPDHRRRRPVSREHVQPGLAAHRAVVLVRAAQRHDRRRAVRRAGGHQAEVHNLGGGIRAGGDRDEVHGAQPVVPVLLGAGQQADHVVAAAVCAGDAEPGRIGRVRGQVGGDAAVEIDVLPGREGLTDRAQFRQATTQVPGHPRHQAGRVLPAVVLAGQIEKAVQRAR